MLTGDLEPSGISQAEHSHETCLETASNSWQPFRTVKRAELKSLCDVSKACTTNRGLVLMQRFLRPRQQEERTNAEQTTGYSNPSDLAQNPKLLKLIKDQAYLQLAPFLGCALSLRVP